ncbi:hypothetical protein [Nocardiopsis metallicus]|uniref:Uncharacterized protein n=1 Tax=Nocardiopsis metallicus TaxID=179819 RepID=A0A840W2A7_9ACTN|nr:hypothetical protein [Nocardiopsis metallicus]MBB5491020.1 hypothetical protein [Nocardiopsis metallicus]
MSNNPQNTPARQTKKTLLFVILAGVLAMFVGIFIQNREDDTPKVGFAANQERYSGHDWDAYEAGYTMARPNFGNAEVPASVARTDDSGTLAGALRADTANAVWWCDNNANCR